MISQTNQTIMFFFAFTKAKNFYAPSATPTVNVGRTGSSSYVVQNGAPTPFPNFPGIYYYTLAAASTANPDDYLAVATTTDTTPDMMQVPSFWAVGNSFAQAVPSVAIGGGAGSLPVLDASGNVQANATAVSAAVQQTLAQIRAGTRGTVWIVTQGGSDSNAGTTWGAAFATVRHALGVAAAYDMILIGPGTFAEGSTPLVVPDRVSIFGSGIDVTTITNTSNLTSLGCCLKPGSYATIQDLTIQSDPTAGNLSAPMGYQSPGQTPFVGATFRRVKLVGWSDGFFIYAGATDVCSYTAWECITSTGFDSAHHTGVTGGSITADYYDCTFTSAVVSGQANQTRGVLTTGATVTVRLFGGRVSVNNLSNGANGYAIAWAGGSGSVIEIYGTALQSLGNATPITEDIYVSAGTVSLFDADYDPAKVNVAGGTINYKQKVAGDVRGKVQGYGTSQINAAGVWAYDTGGTAYPNLNQQIGTNFSTLNTAINNITNLSALANIYGPAQMEIPASGSIAYPLTLVTKDEEGHSLDLAATPTITVANGAGTDRSANLSAVTHAGTGQYTFTYTVSSSAAQEGLTFKASGTASSDSTTRVAYFGSAVVAVDTSTAITAIKAKTDQLVFTGGNVNSAPQTNVTVGGFTSGAITSAAFASGATVPNVTTVATTTSLANLPSIPAGWITAAGIAAGALDGKGDWTSSTVAPSWYSEGGGSGLSGPSSVTLTFVDANNAPVPNVEFTVVGQGTMRANTSGVAAFGLLNGAYTVTAGPVGLTLFADASLTVNGTTAQTIAGSTIQVQTPPNGAIVFPAAGAAGRVF